MEDRTRIVFAARTIESREPGTRIRRPRQSAEAAALLARLAESEGRPNASSKSHSRTAVAAAAALGPHVALGIDIEWVAPERPISAIAQSLLGDVPEMGATDFYRFWTFREAYFKAFQRLPSRAQVLEFLACDAGREVHRMKDGANILERRVAGLFQLALVWHGGNADCVPRDVSGRVRVDSPGGPK